MTYRNLVVWSLGAAAAGALAGCSGAGTQLASPSTPTQNDLRAAFASVPPGRPSTAWWMYYYNPSGNSLSRIRASYTSGLASFTFNAGVYTALLITTNPALTGYLTGKTLNDTIMVSGATSQFVSQGGGSCSSPATVRFYFSKGGKFRYTHYWWSNPVSYTLANGSATLSVPLTDPSQWSDWNGKSGSEETSGFYDAVGDVKWVGLSYGGGCFFENGATVYSGTALFDSQFSETSSR